MSVRRTTVAGALALALLVGACGDDDGEDVAEPEGVCALVDPDALAAAVDLTLAEPEADATSCRFGSTESDAVVGFDYTVLEGVAADTALRATRQSCDADTATDLVPEHASAAFGCRVQGQVTVAVADDEHLGVLTALDLTAEVPDAERFASLLRVADRAFAPADES